MKDLQIVAFVGLLLFSCCIGSSAQDYNPNLIPYRHGNKWGYCDPAKKIIIQPRFSEVQLFRGMLTTVTLDSVYTCVINQGGDILYKTKSYAVICSDGKYYIAGENSYSAQVFDVSGKPVTKMYNKIEPAEYGYIHITANYTKEGLMDSSYAEVVSPKYGSVEFFTKDLVKIYDGDKKKYGLLDLKTQKQFATEYSQVYPPHEGLMMVKKGDLCGFIDMNGTIVIPVKYTKEVPEEEKRDEHYMESAYEGFNYDGFYSGLAVVVDSGRAGYIDRSGTTVIPFEFDKGYGFIGNFAWVQKNGKWGMINKQGKYVLQPVYFSPSFLSAKELVALDGFHEGVVAVAIDSLYGYADTIGKVVIPFQYAFAAPFYEGLAAVRIKGRLGFINQKGEFVIKPRYKWAEGAGEVNTHPFINECAIVGEPDDRVSIIDKKGKPVIPVKFDENNNVNFENGIACGGAKGKMYVFNNRGRVLFTFKDDGYMSHYSGELCYSYKDNCYFNAKTKVRYCD